MHSGLRPGTAREGKQCNALKLNSESLHTDTGAGGGHGCGQHNPRSRLSEVSMSLWIRLCNHTYIQVMVDAVLSAAAAGGSHTCCVVGCTVGHLTSNPELHAEVTICWWIVGVLCFVVFLGGARPLQLLHVTHPIQSFFLLCVTSNPELHAEVTRPDRRPL